MESGKARLMLLVLFTLLFGVVYGSSDLIVRWVPYRISMDQMTWPYWPQLAPLYLSLNILLMVAFFSLKGDKLFRLFTSLCLQTLLVWPIFLFFPLESLNLTQVPQSFFYRLADTLNLTNNYFPSLHVCYAVTCAYYLRHPLLVVWSLGISVSTVLIHQHYPIDALAGLGLALLCCWWTDRTEGRLIAASLSDLLRCVVRHRRYGVIACGLLLYRVFSPARGRTALTGFCYLQRLDDLLDGHLPTEREPEDIALEQADSWQEGSFAQDGLSELGFALYNSGVSRDKVRALIAEMILDRQRVREKSLLTEAELDRHLEATFQLSLDLMLEASGATLRSEDVPSLKELLAWCSVVRDWQEDINLGLINVPQERMPEEALAWLDERHQRALVVYQDVAFQLESVKGQRGYLLLSLFHRSVKKYLDRYDPEELTRISASLHDF